MTNIIRINQAIALVRIAKIDIVFCALSDLLFAKFGFIRCIIQGGDRYVKSMVKG